MESLSHMYVVVMLMVKKAWSGDVFTFELLTAIPAIAEWLEMDWELIWSLVP